MRKLLAGVVVLAVGLAFSGMTTHAQTSITLVGGAGVCASCLDFGVVGSTVTLTMSPSSISGGALASGTQVPGLIPSSLTYSLSESGNILLTGSSGSYTVAAGSGTFDITLKNGSFTLIGVLTIQNLTVTGGSNGQINTTIVANFNITGGTYCAESGSTCGTGVGYGDAFITMSMSCGSNNVTNGCKAGLESINIIMPAGDLATTPEPSSMLLFGTGLLGCGVFLRRRL